jgi:hypothetical protein
LHFGPGEGGNIAGPVSGRIGIGDIAGDDRLSLAGVTGHGMGQPEHVQVREHRGFSLD